MNLEKYTDRARGFVQSAQSLALREGHQQFAPEHVLKVLLDDPEGLGAVQPLLEHLGDEAVRALALHDPLGHPAAACRSGLPDHPRARRRPLR